MTKIEWTHREGTVPVTWNPITGCTPCSEGCKNCYAKRMAHRLAGRCGYPKAPHEFDVTFHPDKLEEPLRWRKPRTVFVASMGDLFHENVEAEWQTDIWKIMSVADQHTFIVLTKRPEIMAEAVDTIGRIKARNEWFRPSDHQKVEWPLPNVWLGVTAENQKRADERIPILLQIPAAVRFVSYEPALGPVDFSKYLMPRACPNCSESFGGGIARIRDRSCPVCGAEGHLIPRLDWIVSGGETGPGSRPAHPEWFRRVRDDCVAAGVPFFFKQWGNYQPICGLYDPDRDDKEDGTSDRSVIVGIRGNIIDSGQPMASEFPFIMDPVGKKRAGSLLDGKMWRQWPS